MQPYSLLFLLLAPCFPYFCPRHHRHLGSHALTLVGGQEQEKESLPSLPLASYYTAPSSPPVPSSSCPSGCSCTPEQEVSCSGSFSDHFPVDQLPPGTSLLTIAPPPHLPPNSLSLSPSLRLLGRLSSLTIARSGDLLLLLLLLLELVFLLGLSLKFGGLSQLLFQNSITYFLVNQSLICSHIGTIVSAIMC